MSKKNKTQKKKREKEPSLLSKIIDIYFEQARRRKALRLLQKQSWSFDFLALLLVKASKLQGRGLSLVITDRSGVSYTLTYDKAKDSDAVKQIDDTIFNHCCHIGNYPSTLLPFEYQKEGNKLNNSVRSKYGRTSRHHDNSCC